MNMARIGKHWAMASAAALALLAGQAQAENYSETLVKSPAVRTQAVSYDDLDISSSEGMQTLHYRISAAARDVCGSNDHRITGHLSAAVDNQACYERAVNEALSQINAGQVASTAE
ncbi:UrcA family protein [Parahaliea aestuarii]|uniref:UrcA family protein n=1 Tax=Parahaliea aestuarii TaxID=1852021 RepID=A0A5C8ZSU3_9GAMM|nr:UrcA family protein [Parahaliea aestuarii]TXS90381.1 UrcA family protein [Parahaliea aestuarii]